MSAWYKMFTKKEHELMFNFGNSNFMALTDRTFSGNPLSESETVQISTVNSRHDRWELDTTRPAWMALSLLPNFRAALGNGLRRFQHVKYRKFRNGIKIPNINL